jgi:hypothetical protein
MCLNSICPWPGDASGAGRQHLGGVWLDRKMRQELRRGVKGLVPRYLPEEAHHDTHTHCVHHIERAPHQPSTLYMQFHGGVYRSDDAGETWADIGTGRGLPSDFGFPLAIDPENPDRAFVIPLVADMDRVTPDGRVRVYETRDRGQSWRALRGLPQSQAILTVLRRAFCNRPAATPLGSTSRPVGRCSGSEDGGETWSTLAARLPPVLSCAVRDQKEDRQRTQSRRVAGRVADRPRVLARRRSTHARPAEPGAARAA